MLFTFGCTSGNTQNQDTQVTGNNNTVKNNVSGGNAIETNVSSNYNVMEFDAIQNTHMKATPQYDNTLQYKGYADLSRNKYILYLNDNSSINIYNNGTYYKITKLGNNCFVSPNKQDFYKIDSNERILFSFLFIDMVKNKSNSMEQYQSFVNKLERKERTYYIHSDTMNETFVKYGEHYYGLKVILGDAGITYNITFSNVKNISNEEFDTALNKEITYGKECKTTDGSTNPFQ